MAKTLILGKSESSYQAALGFDFIQLPRFASDEDRHDFVINILGLIEFDKLIIQIDSDDRYDELRVGLHIRLTSELGQKRLAPMLFVSSDSLAVILRNGGVWARILVTKGCKLLLPDVEAIRSGLDFPALQAGNFGDFLKTIQLQPDETTGRHSLANQWGAYALDKAAGTRALKDNPSLIKAKKQLYFKYVEALNYNPERLSYPPSTIIELHKPRQLSVKATGKKILLIDDEADKGWEDVLRRLFNPHDDFQVISKKVKGWTDFSDTEKRTILKTGFDLFLIDLRLTGSEEESNVKPGKFSGTDVMLQIKADNAGNQVIIFTASNKAWNVKALLEKGADSYYIKESPEYNFPESFSEENFQNFKREAEICLQYSFLKNIWLDHQAISDWLQNSTTRQKYDADQQSKLDQIVTQLAIAYQLLEMRKVQNVSYFSVTYIRILELFVEVFTTIDKGSSTVLFQNGTVVNYFSWNSTIREYVSQTPNAADWESYKSITNRTIAVACQLLGFSTSVDKLILGCIHPLVKSRNNFIHHGIEIPLDAQRLCDWAKTLKNLMLKL